jgi:hypothetical protein
MINGTVHREFVDNQIITTLKQSNSLLSLSALSAEVNRLVDKPSAASHHKILDWPQPNKIAFRAFLKEAARRLRVTAVNTWSYNFSEQLHKQFLNTAATGFLTQASSTFLSVRYA